MCYLDLSYKNGCTYLLWILPLLAPMTGVGVNLKRVTEIDLDYSD